MPNQDSSPQYATCRVCRCTIVRFSAISGWYHTSGRLNGAYNGHFAEPMVRAILTPADVLATAQHAFRHFGLVGEVAV